MKPLLWLLFFGVAAVAVAGDHLPNQLAAARSEENEFSQVEILQRMVEANPTDKLREELIEAWLRVGDSSMAGASVEAFPQAPESLVARVKARNLATEKKDIAAAIAVLQAVKSPSPALLVDLQGLLATQKKWPAVVEVITRQIAVKKTAKLLLSRGLARRSAGDFGKAIQDVRSAAKLDRDEPNVLSTLVVFERLEKMFALIKEKSATLAKNPKDFMALLKRSAAYAAVGLPSEAAADAQSALTLLPDSLAAALVLAYSSEAPARLPISRAQPEPSDDDMGRLIALDADVAAGVEGARLTRLKFVNAFVGQPALAHHEALDLLAREPKNSAAALEELFAAVLLDNRKLVGTAWARMRMLAPTDEQNAMALVALSGWYFRSSDFANAAKFAAMSQEVAPSPNAKRLFDDAQARLNP